jgi:hypothetical protein
MAVLVLQAFDGEDPAGSPLGTLTEAFDKRLTVEDDSNGSGSLSVSRHSSQFAWCAIGNYVLVWRDSTSGDLLGGFWLEAGGDVLVSPDEQGGEEVARSGRGPIATLREALVWHKALVSGLPDRAQRRKGRWHWEDVHPARPLVRLLEEAQERNCIPHVTWDFTRTLDSDGDPWSGEAVNAINVEIGATLLEVVELLRETGLHIEMSADFVLHAWDEQGNDRTAEVTLAAAVDVRDTVEREPQGSRIAKAALVEGDNEDDDLRYRYALDPDVELGRRVERFYRYPRTATPDLLLRVARRKLRKWSRMREGPLTIPVIEVANQVALVDYWPGDTVSIDITGYSLASDRIGSITLVETEAGEYDPVVQFADLSVDSDGGLVRMGPSGDGDADAPETQVGTRLFDDWDRTAEATAPEPVASASDVDTTFSEGITEVTVSLPAGSDSVGRFLLMLLAWDQHSQMDVAAVLAAHDEPWTAIGSPVTAAGDVASQWFYRVVDGTEPYGAFPYVVFDLAPTNDALVHVAGVVESLDGVTAADTDVASHGSANPPNLAQSGGYAGGTPVRHYAAALTDGGAITAGPTGYAIVGEDDDTGLVLRVDALEGTNAAENPDTYSVTGALTAYTLRVRGVGASLDLGSIPTQDATGAWWPGGNPYVVTSDPGAAPVVDLGPHLTITADAPEEHLTARLEAPPKLPHQRDEWTHLVTVTLDATVVPGDDGERYVGWTAQAGGRVDTFQVRFGDGQYDAGVRVGEEHEDFAISDGVAYRFRFGMVGGDSVARIWEDGDAEPGSWLVNSGTPDSADESEADSLTLDLELGGESGDQVLHLADMRATTYAAPGGIAGWHMVARGDGTTVVFDVGEAYVPMTLRARVDGAEVEPTVFHASAGTFRLADAPYGDPEDPDGSALVEARYTRA